MGVAVPPLPQYAFMAWCSVGGNTGATLSLLFLYLYFYRYINFGFYDRVRLVQYGVKSQDYLTYWHIPTTIPVSTLTIYTSRAV
jgi:hypothetical protein